MPTGVHNVPGTSRRRSGSLGRRPHRNETDIALEVATIQQLDRVALKARWEEIHGRPPPKGMSRRLLERACAYAIQAEAFGGLSRKSERRLARDAAPSRRPKRASMSVGSRLVREWNGKVHSVEVVVDGFVWNGKRFGSLSAVAFAITGAKCVRRQDIWRDRRGASVEGKARPWIDVRRRAFGSASADVGWSSV
jgi:hypothetical protein